MNLSVFPVIQCSVFNEKSIRIPENTGDRKLAWIVSKEYGENYQQAGSAAVISSNDKHTSTRGAATHILHSFLDPDSSLTRFPTPNTNVSEQATTWCFITHYVVCLFMVASINCAILPQIKRYNSFFLFFLVWVISCPTLNVAISWVLFVTFFFISFGPHYLSSELLFYYNYLFCLYIDIY